GLIFGLFCTRGSPAVSSTLSLHDALPICVRVDERQAAVGMVAHDRHVGRLSAPPANDGDVARASLLRRERIAPAGPTAFPEPVIDRKSTRLNSSHVKISYAVFCLKKKKKK